MNLDLGGCNHSEKNYINLDICPFKNVDVVHDMEKSLPFKNNLFEHIKCEHSLEHCSIISIPLILKECYRVLQKNGTLKITVPCLESAMKSFLDASEEERWEYRIEYIFGNQGKTQDGQQLHKTGFTADRLRYLCEHAGFIIDNLYSEPNSIKMVCLTIKCHKNE